MLEEDNRDYLLIQDQDLESALDRARSEHVQSETRRIAMFSPPSTFMRVGYDGQNTISITPHRTIIIPSLKDMVNAAVASQLRFFIDDINDEIVASSKPNWRRAYSCAQALFWNTIIIGSVVFGIVEILRYEKNVDREDSNHLESTLTALLATCQSVFLLANGTCSILANDPPICLEKIDNCPTTSCDVVMPGLLKCYFPTRLANADTRNMLPYSTPFTARLQQCDALSGWQNYTDVCSDYKSHSDSADSLFSVMIIAVMIAASCCICVSSVEFNYQSSPEKMVEAERKRVLKKAFKDFLPAMSYLRNPAYKILLDMDLEPDVTVGEVFDKLTALPRYKIDSTTQRFFKRTTPRAMVLEVLDDTEETQLLLPRAS